MKTHACKQINLDNLRNFFLAILTLASLFIFTNYSHARSAPDSFAELAIKLLPAVVNISTTHVFFKTKLRSSLLRILSWKKKNM